MTNLRSVTLYTLYSHPHGISWEALRHILSLPNVREFTLQTLRCCAKDGQMGDTRSSEEPIEGNRGEIAQLGAADTHWHGEAVSALSICNGDLDQEHFP